MSIKRKDLREEVQELCFCSSIGELFALSCEPSTRGAHRLIRKMHCVPNLARKSKQVLLKMRGREFDVNLSKFYIGKNIQLITILLGTMYISFCFVNKCKKITEK